ncbi:MAG: hypothetical protein U0797_25670 [Gemmataceae bacterium]
MKRRHAWLGGAGLSSLLLAGCLLQQSSVRPPKPAEGFTPTGEGNAKLASAAGDGDPAVPAPPAPPSDYHTWEGAPLPEPAAPKREEARPVATRKLQPPEEPAPPAPAAPKPTPEAPLVAALRCAVEKHPDEAKRLLEKYDHNDRELLLGLVRLTADLGEGELKRLSPEEMTKAVEQLSAVTSGLRRKAPLVLDKACFCKKIQGFGRYEPWGEAHEFQAGSDGKPGERVQVYAEVRNFASKAGGGRHETVLESRLEIRDAQRNEIANIDLGRCVDHSLTPRQDYFLNFQLHVPPKMPPGLYTLWLKVKDVSSDPPRETSCSLDFKVRAAGGEDDAAGGGR